jgi:hypothetical protein
VKPESSGHGRVRGRKSQSLSWFSELSGCVRNRRGKLDRLAMPGIWSLWRRRTTRADERIHEGMELTRD